MNLTKKLPDAYAKDVNSNVYKLLQLDNLLANDFRCELLSIEETNDLNTATGKTLDLYGEMIGVLRNGATDEQYRLKINNQIGINSTDTDCNSIIKTIAKIFGVNETSIRISENNMSIGVIGLTIENLQDSGYSSEEITALIKKLKPAGVEFTEPYYAGTLKVDYDIEDYNEEFDYFSEYPILQSAWKAGQIEKLSNGGYNVSYNRGLSGEGEVPEDWKALLPTDIRDSVLTSGTFEGGTLGILSGEA